MGFPGWKKILLDAEMNLYIAACKPAPTALCEFHGLWDFYHSQHVAIELTCRVFLSGGHRNLDMIDRREMSGEHDAGQCLSGTTGAGVISPWRSISRNGFPEVSSFRSRRSVQSQSLQAHGSDPFWSRHRRRSCASCTRVRSKYLSQYGRSS